VVRKKHLDHLLYNEVDRFIDHGKKGRTSCIHVLLYFANEIPDFRAAFGVLKAECIVDAIRFSPNNECV